MKVCNIQPVCLSFHFQEQCGVNVLQVVPAESRHELLKTKVEVRLRKAAPATWPKLEAGAAAPVATNFSNPALAHPPAYPSSARCAVSPKRAKEIGHACTVDS